MMFIRPLGINPQQPQDLFRPKMIMTLLLFYTDPGSGVMLLQMLLAMIAGAGFYFRSFFLSFFGRGAAPASEENAAETNVTNQK